MSGGTNSSEATSAWYKVPCWDGSPNSWRAFKREMDWWVSSLDLEATKKFNLAARWLLRQSGVVRQRGEEFTPEELEYQKEMKGTDDAGNEIILIEEDLLFGLNKLLAALEEINGRTVLDKRGELRATFYTRSWHADPVNGWPSFALAFAPSLRTCGWKGSNFPMRNWDDSCARNWDWIP